MLLTRARLEPIVSGCDSVHIGRAVCGFLQPRSASGT
jgi:hypothetical protein